MIWILSSDFSHHRVSQAPEAFSLCDDGLARTQPTLRSTRKANARGRSGANDVTSLERCNRREVCDEVGYSKDQLARIRMLQDFIADREPDVERMWVRHFILGDDRWPKRRERIETLPQRPLSRGHLHISRTYIVHDCVAEDMLLPNAGGNILTAFSDDEGEFSLVIGLLR